LPKQIKLLPQAKTYAPATVTVAVGKLKYTFEKKMPPGIINFKS
jgi:hypothetical protein